MANLKIILGYFTISLIFFLVACIILRCSGKYDDTEHDDKMIALALYFVLAILWPVAAVLGLGMLILTVGRRS